MKKTEGGPFLWNTMYMSVCRWSEWSLGCPATLGDGTSVASQQRTDWRLSWPDDWLAAGWSSWRLCCSHRGLW